MGEHRAEEVEELLGIGERVGGGDADRLLQVGDAGLRVGRRAADDRDRDAPLGEDLLTSPGGREVARAEDDGVDVGHEGTVVEEPVDLVVSHDPVAELHEDEVHVRHLGDDRPRNAGDVVGVHRRGDAAIEEAQGLGGSGALHADRVLQAGDAGDLGAADLEALPRQALDEFLGHRGLADVHAGAAHEDDGFRLGQNVDLRQGALPQVPPGDAQHLHLDGFAQVLVAAHEAADDAAEVEDVELVAGREPVGGVADEAPERLAAAEDARDDVALFDGHAVAVRSLQLRIERVFGQGADDDELARLARGLAEHLDGIRQLERIRRGGDEVDLDLHGCPLSSWDARWDTSCGAVAPGEVLAWTEALGVRRSKTSLSKSSLNFRRSANFIFTGERSSSAQCLMRRATAPWASRKGMPFLARYSARSVASIWGSLAISSIRSSRTFMPSMARWMARIDSRAVSAAPKTGGLVSWRSRL